MAKYEFTSSGILDRIVTPCKLDVTDYETTSDSSEKVKPIKALWDTGSTVTVLSELIVEQMGLVPTDISRVSGWDGNPLVTNTYNIDVLLGDLHVEFINAVRGPLKNVDMILGMDILGQGNLHITHPSFSTHLKFEIND